MARFYYTANGTVFPGPSGTDGEPYLEGRSYTLPATAPGNGITLAPLKEAAPKNGLYLAVEDNTLCDPPDYYFREVALSMQGPLLGPSTTVLETVTCTQIPIDNLLATKRAELMTFADAVLFSSFKMTGSGGTEFWVNASLRSRLYRTDVDAFYQWTPPDEPAPLNLITQTGREPVVSNSGRAWRNVPVWLVRVSNQNDMRIKAEQDEWEALKEAQGRFSIDVAYAADDVESLLESAHASGDWAALAAIDVTADPNATNPWPEHSLSSFNGAAF